MRMRNEKLNFEIGEIGRNFGVLGPVEAVCQPKGFNRWCTLPYSRHEDGCPNFGVRPDCPPKAPYFLDVYEPEVYVACLDFDFRSYLNQRRLIHADWSEKALRNPRHWQNHLRSELRQKVAELYEAGLEGLVPEYNGEAMGVNIHMTCQNTGINLEWPPRERMYRIALLAKPREE